MFLEPLGPSETRYFKAGGNGHSEGSAFVFRFWSGPGRAVGPSDALPGVDPAWPGSEVAALVGRRFDAGGPGDRGVPEEANSGLDAGGALSWRSDPRVQVGRSPAHGDPQAPGGDPDGDG